MATYEATKEVVWLCNFLTDRQVAPKVQELMTLYCDNNGVVTNSKEPRSHKRGKHFERRYHLLREIVHKGDIIVTKIDIAIKALATKVFKGHLEGIGLHNMTHML